MTNPSETIDQSAFWDAPDPGGPPLPGALLVFSAGEPLQAALPLPSDGSPLALGRLALPGIQLNDPRMSRQHARLWREGETWLITDLGSRNGTAVDGQPVQGTQRAPAARVLRTGDTLFVLCPNLRPYLDARVEVLEDQDLVLGPRLLACWDQIRRAAAGGASALHVTGESGAGKELAARAFHRFGPCPQGPFVAVNCAAIPEGVAERLLFGARKGAFSGAHADAAGYVQEAHGGTLFLDEIGELDLQVQAKLLRVVETREVLALGASRPQRVDVRICSATHRDLRLRVQEGRFREDLFFRIGRPAVAVPPLRERPDEIPFLLERELRRGAPALLAHVSLVEACLLRHWPGNVRELLVEARAAAAEARAQGDTVVRLSHLAPHAGRAIDAPTPPPASVGAPEADEPAKALPDRDAIEAALRRCEGRVATAARDLGVHRNQLRRWLSRHEVDPAAFVPPGAPLPVADDPADPDPHGG